MMVSRRTLYLSSTLVVLLHGGFIYNTVAVRQFWKRENLADPHNDGFLDLCLSVFMASDMMFGTGLAPLLDIIGPRKMSVLGHTFMICGWGMYLLPAEYARFWLPLSCAIQGTATQLVCIPAVALGNMFAKNRDILLGIMVTIQDMSAVVPFTINNFLVGGEDGNLPQIAGGVMILTSLSMLMVNAHYEDTFANIVRRRSLTIDDGLLQIAEVPLISMYETGGVKTTSSSDTEQSEVATKGVWSTLFTQEYIALVIVYIIITVQWQFISVFFPSVINALPKDQSHIGGYSLTFIYSFIMGPGCLFPILMGYVAQRWGPHVVTVYNILGLMTTIQALRMKTRYWMLAGEMVYASTQGGIWLTFLLHVLDFIPEEFNGTATGTPSYLAGMGFFAYSMWFNNTVPDNSRIEKLDSVWRILYFLSIPALGIMLYLYYLQRLKPEKGAFAKPISQKLDSVGRFSIYQSR